MNGLSIVYLAVNQCYAVMWMDQVLKLVPTKVEAAVLVKEWST